MREHVGTLREYVCYVGRLKGSMYLVNARLVRGVGTRNTRPIYIYIYISK